MTSTLESVPSTDNPASTAVDSALALCIEAWTVAHQKAMKSNRGRYEADAIAARAYRLTLPTLSGAENIRSYIACVAHGMAIGAIEGANASRLLYAAQVAMGASRASAPGKKTE